MCKWFAIFCQGDKECIVVFGCFQFLLFFTSDESESGSFVSPVQNTGMGSLSLLQGIFPIQGSNPGLPHCRRILYQLRHKGGPISSVQFSRVWLFSTPWITACQASLSITNSLSLLKPCPSLTQWTWLWASSGSWWWTGRPGVLQSMRLQRVRHDWAT